MGERTSDAVIYFNTADAACKLTRGSTPEVVFGSVFGWSLTPVTLDDVKKNFIHYQTRDYSQAIVDTLLSGACHDIGIALSNTSHNPLHLRRPFSLNDKVEGQPSSEIIEVSLMPVWRQLDTQLVTAINNPIQPTLARVIAACGDLIQCSPEDTTNAIQNKLETNRTALSSTMRAYLQLLTDVFLAHQKNNPRVGELVNGIVSSYRIIGQQAGRDINYFNNYGDLFIRFDPRFKDETSYDSTKFELKPKSGNRWAVVPQKVFLDKVEEEFKQNSQQINIVTSCPANLSFPDDSEQGQFSLTEIILNKLAENIVIQASK